MTIPGQDPASRLAHKHVVHENGVGGSSVLRGFPLVIAVSERDMPGFEPGPLIKSLFQHIQQIMSDVIVSYISFLLIL